MNKFILSILFVASINTANAGGIPVFDGVNLAQNIQQVMHALETINQLKEQLDKMKEQLKVAEDALASMSDPRGYASIIQSTYSMDTDVNYQGVFDKFDLKSDTSDWELSTEIAQYYTEGNNNAAWYYENAQELLETSKQRVVKLSQLVGAVDGTQDQKDVLDLQTRTAGELALLQNEKIKLEAIKAQAEAHKEMQERQRIQNALNTIDSGSINKQELIEFLNNY